MVWNEPPSSQDFSHASHDERCGGGVAWEQRLDTALNSNTVICEIQPDSQPPSWYRLCAGLWGCSANFYVGKKYLKLCCCGKQGQTTLYPCGQSLNHYLAIMLNKVMAACHQYQVLLGHMERWSRWSSQGLGKLGLCEKVLRWVAYSCPDIQLNTVMQLVVSGDVSVVFLPLNS